MKRYHAIAILALVIGAGAVNVDAAPVNSAALVDALQSAEAAKADLVQSVLKGGVAAGVVPGREKQTAYAFANLVERNNNEALQQGYSCEKIQQVFSQGLASEWAADEKTESNMAILNAVLRYQLADCKARTETQAY